jgi:hypothetical protein
MRRVLLVIVLAAGALSVGAVPAGACHPPDPVTGTDLLGCPHCIRVDGVCTVPPR